jgi:hypothetical protein
MFLLKAILYVFLIFTLNKLEIVYEFLLHFYVGRFFFFFALRKNTTSGHFFIATDRVVKMSIKSIVRISHFLIVQCG